MPAARPHGQGPDFEAADRFAPHDGHDVGPLATQNVDGRAIEYAFGMGIPANDDSSRVHDRYTGPQPLQQLKILIRQASNHAPPPGARRNADILSASPVADAYGICWLRPG